MLRMTIIQKGEPMSDLISRQAAIEETWKEPSYTDPLNVLAELRDRIKDLPSAQPGRKTGKWNFIGNNMFECTSCGVVYTTRQLNGLRNYDTDPYAPKFCPNCGADMRGEQDETN